MVNIINCNYLTLIKIISVKLFIIYCNKTVYAIFTHYNRFVMIY